MRKWLFSSGIALVVIAFIACQPRAGDQGTSHSLELDTGLARNDSLTPPDRTHVDIDTTPHSVDGGGPGDTLAGIGGARKPGQTEAPRPGTVGKVDSIKGSYPKKK